jgi:hypothetical protein
MYAVGADGTLTELVKATNVTEDAAEGLLKYTWQTGDTDLAGTHLAAFRVVVDGKIETYPRNGYIEIRIQEVLPSAPAGP